MANGQSAVRKSQTAATSRLTGWIRFMAGCILKNMLEITGWLV
jgi:hypothetical protein